jgi:hypothetical protein
MEAPAALPLGLGGCQNWSGRYAGEISCPCRELNPDSSAIQLAVVCILNELSRLHMQLWASHFERIWEVQQFRWFVVGVSARKSGFQPRVVYVGSLVDKVAPGQVSLQSLLFPPSNYLSVNTTYPFIIMGWYSGPERLCFTPPLQLSN